jgi:hypothetical protein
MTCAECRDELMLSFGQRRNSQDVESHLAGCANCRAFAAELSATAARIADESAFYPDRGEAIRLAAKIERSLDNERTARTVSLHWLPYVAVAASIVLLAGIALIGRGHWSGSGENGSSQMADTSVLPGYSAVNVLDNGLTEQNAELNDADVQALLEDYTSGGTWNAGERLINGLTEAEMQYLKENLTVKDIL